MLGAAAQAPFDTAGRTIALTQSSDLVAVAATQRSVAAVGRALDALELRWTGPTVPATEADAGTQ